MSTSSKASEAYDLGGKVPSPKFKGRLRLPLSWGCIEQVQHCHDRLPRSIMEHCSQQGYVHCVYYSRQQ